jgi:hypothetical protein
MNVLDELFVTLGVKTDSKGLNDAIKGFQILRNNIALIGGVSVAALFGVKKFVDGTVNSVAALNNLNQQTGLSIDKLQKWSQVAQLSNLSISAEQATNSIATLQKNLAAIHMGQGNIAPFQLLGLDVNTDAFGILEQLRGKIGKLNNATATNLISQLGLNPEFLSVLKLSRAEFDKLGANRFLNGKQRQDIIALGTTLKQITLEFKILKDQAVAKLAPELTKLTQGFFKWMTQNGNKIIDVITGIVRGMSVFSSTIGNVISMLSVFVEKITGVENGLKVLATIAIGLGLAFSPILTTLGLIVGLLDDIAVWKKGGQSLLGNIFGDYNSSKVGKFFQSTAKEGKKQTFDGNIHMDENLPGTKLVRKIQHLFQGDKDVQKQATDPFINRYITSTIPGQNTKNNNVSNNITMNIQGTGSPEDTAHFVVQELERTQLKYANYAK